MVVMVQNIPAFRCRCNYERACRTNMKGVKRKLDELDEISSASNESQKLLQPSEEGNVANGPIHDVDRLSNTVDESSSSQRSDDINGVLETESDDETEIATKFAEEMVRIVNEMIIPEVDGRVIVEAVTKDLRNALGWLDESYEIVPFGSFINGLVCRESDVDFFLKTSTKCKSSKQIQALLNKTAKRLYKSKKFYDVCRIAMARVPILRFTHSAIDCRCDLSFTNEIGVRNTLLVQFYLSLNRNLKPLVLFLKYLLELYDLHGCQKITTYMLFWLVVYYMQQRDILPPVQSIRESVSEPYLVDGWDCRVPSPYVAPVHDFVPLFSHLKAFLAFYSTFDFLYYVISPYLACPISVDDFENMRIPFDRFTNYFNKVQNGADTTFNFSLINVQDPTELNMNVTRQVELPALNLFRSFCYHFYALFAGSSAKKLVPDQTLTNVLPKEILTNKFHLPSNCIQSETHNLTANRLPTNHPAQKTFAVNGVLFFAKRLEGVMKLKLECDVETIISDQTLRINRRRGELRRKVVPVAYFRCSVCRGKLVEGEQNDGIISFHGEDASKAVLFIIMDTTFSGDEIRIRFEGCAGFLRYLFYRHNILNLLVQVPE